MVYFYTLLIEKDVYQMKPEIIEEIFNDVENILKREFIGQEEYFSELCKYFKKKTSKDRKGVLMIIERRQYIQKNEV